MDFTLGIQDPLVLAVVSEFRRGFARRGQLAWVVDTGPELAFVSMSPLARCVTASVSLIDLPNVGIEESESRRLILIDAASAHGALDENRRKMLALKIGRPALELVFVTAYRDRSELTLLTELPWGTTAWFKNEPGHFIDFNGGSIRGAL